MTRTFFIFLSGLFFAACLMTSGCGGKQPSEKKSSAQDSKKTANEILIGSLCDKTGPTSDVGKEYAYGIKEAVQYVNDTGGINGKKIKLIQTDYAYKISEAITTYKKYKQKKVVAILGWGTGDTEALSKFVKKDKIPYVSASYSGHLADTSKTPYNIFFSPDYSTQVRGLIQAWHDNVWKKKPEANKRKPRIAFMYHTKHPFSKSAIKAGKDHATLLGFEIGDDQNVSLKALEAKSQISALIGFKPDVLVHTNTVSSVASTIRDAFAKKLGADHLLKNWAFDETLPKIAQQASEGVYGVAPTAFFGMNADLMDKAQEYAKKMNPEMKIRTIRALQAWANVLGLAEALRRADKAGGLTGENILKKGFETMKDFKIGLGMAPVTFSAKDHRGMSEVKVYQIKGGKFNLFASVDLKKLHSDKWDKWLGW